MKQSVAIIDPVGSKAGIDQYDILLLQGMKVSGFDCTLYSNFEYTGQDFHYHRNFFNTDVAKWKSVLSLFTGFFKSLRDAKKKNIPWLILHIFRAGIFDLFSLTLARLMGFKILAIIHDIESLDTFTLPIIRKTVIGTLPHLRVVHNQFCKDELSKSIGKVALMNTGIVPHVNFINVFSEYHKNPFLQQQLLKNEKLLNELDPSIPQLIAEKIPFILFFGQIKKAKGLDILLEAVSLCTTNFRLIIAGKLRNETRERYDQLISTYQISEKVIPLIRHITDIERDTLFALATCIVLPYRWIYQSGVLLMTMSFPMAVIASDLSPNRDLVENGRNGLLFPSENPKALAAKIDDLVSGRIDATSLKSRAITDVMELYSPEKTGAAFAKLIKEY
ncbi:hypothetical protein BH11BAC2_BH11BAC2_09430 [soil metagenome]